MPMGDKTGPTGAGSNTGRGLGRCNPGEEKTVGSLRYGMGRGFQKACGRRGLGSGIARNSHSSSDEESLTEEKKILESRLVEVNDMLNTGQNK